MNSAAIAMRNKNKKSEMYRNEMLDKKVEFLDSKIKSQCEDLTKEIEALTSRLENLLEKLNLSVADVSWSLRQ